MYFLVLTFNMFVKHDQSHIFFWVLKESYGCSIRGPPELHYWPCQHMRQGEKKIHYSWIMPLGIALSLLRFTLVKCMQLTGKIANHWFPTIGFLVVLVNRSAKVSIILASASF